MKLKKRLYISNIMMILLPIVFVVLSGYVIFLLSIVILAKNFINIGAKMRRILS